ncbi:MAG: hypothetical protein KJ734_13430, partial [Chloroflexi bacterium]|nr:hypothetical protein [Chloroflexota bacterium]
QRMWGTISVDLDQAEGRAFVEAFLDSEPNRLGTTFREALYRHTGGQALFTVELLRGLQEHGDLVRDETGRWMEGPTLDWDRLPARVEAVIAERVGQLPPEWQALLTAASVEGEVFTAEVVARVQGMNEDKVVRGLSGALSQSHQLVTAHSRERLRPGGQCLSRYRFRHHLFQRYLYQRLDLVEQARLHEATGRAIEWLLAANPAALEAEAGQLARHFAMAGLPVPAAAYHLRAGVRAVRLMAY